MGLIRRFLSSDRRARRTSLRQIGSAVSTEAADRLRDARQYEEAAEAYQAALERAPMRTDLRVQHANMLKDSGRLEEAEAAYRAALAQAPDDADIYLQLGHALKLQGRRSHAIDAYREAAELAPFAPQAVRELANLDDGPAQQALGAVQPSLAPAEPDQFAWAAGGPLGPIPRSLTIVPEALRCCEALPPEEEIAGVLAVRKIFRMGDYHDPWTNDVVRAFRLIRGAKAYLEIGTFDRGNLAYVSTLLSEDAIIIGLDIQDEPAQDEKLRNFIKTTQTYLPILGDSRLPSTFELVKNELGGRRLDAVFIDANHTAHAVLCDYANSERLVRDDGVILLHDSVWEGDAHYKGVADALAEINTADPVYLVDSVNPPRRFMRALWKVPVFGVVGVVFASEQRWRQVAVLSSEPASPRSSEG